MTTILDVHGPMYRQYRRLRDSGWPARSAAWHVKKSAELDIAEMNDEITFKRVIDYDYTVEKAWCGTESESDIADMRRYYDEEIEKLNSGEWTAWGIQAEINQDAACRLCHTPADHQNWRRDFSTEASLWGIVCGNRQSDDAYLREVEIELAIELGILSS